MVASAEYYSVFIKLKRVAGSYAGSLFLCSRDNQPKNKIKETTTFTRASEKNQILRDKLNERSVRYEP